jgi:hypothetical protein
MKEPALQSELDRLAAELAREVRHAAGARTNAELVAAFHGMTHDVDTAAIEIDQYAAVLRGPSPLVPPEHYPGELRARTEWVQAQIGKVRETLEKDPMRVRQGALWRETQKAFNTLRTELLEVLDAAYSGLVDSFAADDRHVLETLPPGIAGARDYRIAIDDFERYATTRPGTPDDVKQAAAAGRRLKSLRETVEADAVPQEFQDQWRQVRTTGLPLAELTDAFVGWLRERGLANSTVLTYRAQ